jgi:hypothetical protein
MTNVLIRTPHSSPEIKENQIAWFSKQEQIAGTGAGQAVLKSHGVRKYSHGNDIPCPTKRKL